MLRVAIGTFALIALAQGMRGPKGPPGPAGPPGPTCTNCTFNSVDAGTLTVTGNAAVGGSLTVTHDVDLGGSLNATGNVSGANIISSTFVTARGSIRNDANSACGMQTVGVDSVGGFSIWDGAGSCSGTRKAAITAGGDGQLHTLQIGSGTVFTQAQYCASNWSPGAISSLTCADMDESCSGAAVGDAVAPVFPQQSGSAIISVTPDAGSLHVHICNPLALSPLTPSPGQYGGVDLH